jgi:hypothetical protein
MSLITDLGLDQQYTTDPPILYPLPIVFSKVIDKEYISYLVSLGVTCILDTSDPRRHNAPLSWISLYLGDGQNMHNVNTYLSKGDLIPLSTDKKRICINFCGLKLIQEND